MKNIEDIQYNLKRLEDMKQVTILNYLSQIDLDDNMHLYDTMIHLLVEGKLDDVFSSSVFQNMNMEEKKKLQMLARKYVSLCFFEGNPDYWTDSIEGISLRDYDFICMKIFDNYNYLLEIARDSGESVLEQMKRIQNTDIFSGKVMIDFLRNAFDDDQLLKESLNDICSKEGAYYELTDKEKAVLLFYPDGVLYTNNSQGEKEKQSVSKLKEYILERISSKRDLTSVSFSELADMLGEYNFEEIISDIYLDYLSNIISYKDEIQKRKHFMKEET